MPIVSSYSAAELNHDITHDFWDAIKREYRGRANGLKPLKLTFGDVCSKEPNSDEFKDAVRRGQIDPVDKCWLGAEMPVFNVQIWRFSEDDIQRFFTEFRNNQSEENVYLHFEPDLEDIEIREHAERPRHMPSWMLQELKTMGQFEYGMQASMVNAVDGRRRLTQKQYDNMMVALEKRLATDKPAIIEKPKDKKELVSVGADDFS